MVEPYAVVDSKSTKASLVLPKKFPTMSKFLDWIENQEFSKASSSSSLSRVEVQKMFESFQTMKVLMHDASKLLPKDWPKAHQITSSNNSYSDEKSPKNMKFGGLTVDHLISTVGQEMKDSFNETKTELQQGHLQALVPYLGTLDQEVLGTADQECSSSTLASLFRNLSLTVKTKKAAAESSNSSSTSSQVNAELPERRISIACGQVGKLLRKHFVSKTQLGLSMYLYSSGCPVHCITALNRLGMVAGVDLAKDSLKMISHNVRPISTILRSSHIIGIDNWDVLCGFRTVNSTRTSEFNNCVCSLEIHVPPMPAHLHYPVILADDAVSFALSMRLNPDEENSLCRSLWSQASSSWKAGAVISVGTSPTAESPRVGFFIRPVIVKGQMIPTTEIAYSGNLGNTSSMSGLLQMFNNYYISAGNVDLLFIVGDEQSYESMWKLKVIHPETYVTFIYVFSIIFLFF